MANIFITGVSSGIGKTSAERLIAGGHRVVGGSRRPTTFRSPLGHWVALDVTDPASIVAAGEEATGWLGEVDVVVNNAGVTLNAFVEETPVAEARALFETDFWGVVGVNSFFLPAMRSRRSGRIVIVGSLAGRVGAIGQGFYSAAKHALEGYGETLAAEVEGFGIAVNIVEPGFHRTALHVGMQRRQQYIADYDRYRDSVSRSIEQAFTAGADPVRVADAICRLIERNSSALRHPVGSDARWVPRLKNVVPPSLFMARLRNRFGMR